MSPTPFALRPDVGPPAPSRLGRGTERVGLAGVLADLDRVARGVVVPGEAAVQGLAWDEKDQRTRRWYPQGITTSADGGGEGSTLLASWYGKGLLGRWLGSRVTVVDDVDADAPRYRHVLLVEPRPSRLLRRPWRRWRAVRVHAGGIVWYGPHLFVAGSGSGLRTFRLDDVVRVRSRWRTGGHRYVLPQSGRWHPSTSAGVRAMTYSFLSLHRQPDADHLVAGEYGRNDAPAHRLTRFPLDRTTHLPLETDGVTRPVEIHERQVPRMQGAVVADGVWALTSSNGEGNPGDLWVGRPGAFRRHRAVLPTGPEDLTWWPGREQLWTLTEWPGRRWVLAIDRRRWTADEPT